MASTDVIRCHWRLRLSIKQLYSFRYGGTGQLVSRDVSDPHGSFGTIRDLPVTGHLQGRSTVEPTQTWVPVLCPTKASSVPVMEEDGDSGDSGSAAAMASQDEAPATPTPSDVYVGGCGVGEETKPSFFSLSDLINVKDECVEDKTVKTCVEELSALTISYDSAKQSPNRSSKVSKLLDLLRTFGVKSLPVKYLDKPLREENPEVFCKNLFLKDRRNQYYLVICDENEDIDLKTLRRKLKAYRNFSFATPEEMSAILQVHPGGVTPFALMHGSARDVRVAMTIDLTIDNAALLNFHPLDHTLTLPLKLAQLKQFLAHFRFDLEIIDMES